MTELKTSKSFRTARRITLALGSFSAFLAILPANLYHRIGDSLAADGQLELLTEALIRALRLGFGFVAIVFFALTIFAFFDSGHAESAFRSWLGAIRAFPENLRSDRRALLRSARAALKIANPSTRLWFILICLFGFVLRAALLNRPITHDEAYTVVTWSSGSLRYAISNYHLPNNHIFHTVAVWLIYHLLGNTPTLIRIPAFLAGFALIPAVFYLGRRRSGDAAALLGAFLTAVSSFLIDYASLARGYSFFALCAVLFFLLGDPLLHRRNRALEIWLPILAALSFWTVPMTLYPFGAWCVAFAVQALFFASPDAPVKTRILRLAPLLRVGAAAIFWTLLLYAPLLLESGTTPLFDNVFVRPLPPDDFPPTMISRMIDFWNVWREGLGTNLAALLLTAAVISMGFALFSRRFPPIAACILWVVPLVLIRRPNLWTRTLIFLFPFIYLAASDGLVRLFTLTRALFPARFRRSLTIAAITLAAISAVLLSAAAVQRTRAIAALKSPHERAVRTILTDPAPSDGIYFAVAPEDDAALWYYADRYKLPKRLFDRNRPFSVVYVYVNSENAGFEEPRTVEELIERYGPGRSFLDWTTRETIWAEPPTAELIRFGANGRVIRETFQK